MDKRKIVKIILFIIVILGAIFALKIGISGNVWSDIIEWNLEISGGKFYLLLLVYWIQIFIILLFWDLCMQKIHVEISLFLDWISEYLLKKDRIRLSIECIRLEYGFSKVMHFVRLGWWRYGSSDNDNIVWNNIKRPVIKDTIFTICANLIKLPLLIAIFLTTISLKWLEISDIQENFEFLSEFEFDFWKIISKLSPLTVGVLLVFIWYFVSAKGNIRRVIAQANRKKIEENIQIQRNLIQVIASSIYTISSNLHYVIKCQELVTDLWIHSRFPDYKFKENIIQRDLKVESYHFKDISELEDISKLLEELNSNENWCATRLLSGYKYEFLIFMLHSNLLDSEKLNRIFFTQKGMNNLTAENKSPRIENSTEEISKIREDYLEGMPGRIVDSLKMLYIFYRYYNKMNKLLNFKADKVGRALRMFTGKE